MKRTNTPRNLLLSLALAAGIFAAPAYAQISFQINIAPPAPQYEIVPNVAPGYVWAPGYWGWTGERHVWVRGRPLLQREGYRWAPDRWDQRDRGYYRTAGHWESDRGYRSVQFNNGNRHMGHVDDNGKRGRGGNDHDRGHGKGNKHGD